MPALLAALRTTSHSTFAVIPLPQTRPVLLIDRKIAPSVMPLASFHSSIAAFTHAGIGTVRMCPAFPIRSAIPAFLSQLRGVHAQGQQLAPSQPASHQRGKNGVVPFTAERIPIRARQQLLALLGC